MKSELLRKLRICAVCVLALVATAMVGKPASAMGGSSARGFELAKGPQGFGTISQKGLRLVIKVLKSPGMPRIMNFLSRHQATEEQISSVVRYAAGTAKILETFTKVDQASLGFVRGQVEALLVKNLGATQVDASRVGFWVEKMLDWGI